MSDVRIDDLFEARDSSNINISGGSFGELRASGSSQINITNVDTISSHSAEIFAHVNSQVALSGGTFGRVWGDGSTNINITGGRIKSYLQAFDYSNISVTGGNMDGGLSSTPINKGMT